MYQLLLSQSKMSVLFGACFLLFQIKKEVPEPLSDVGC